MYNKIIVLAKNAIASGFDMILKNYSYQNIKYLFKVTILTLKLSMTKYAKISNFRTVCKFLLSCLNNHKFKKTM